MSTRTTWATWWDCILINRTQYSLWLRDSTHWCGEHVMCIHRSSVSLTIIYSQFPLFPLSILFCLWPAITIDPQAYKTDTLLTGHLPTSSSSLVFHLFTVCRRGHACRILSLSVLFPTNPMINSILKSLLHSALYWLTLCSLHLWPSFGVFLWTTSCCCCWQHQPLQGFMWLSQDSG